MTFSGPRRSQNPSALESGPSPVSPPLFRAAFRPLDIAPLVYFRIAFGLILLWEVFRYYDHGWIERYYVDPDFHFKYWGFEWVHAWPGTGMNIHFAILALLAIQVILGFLYRLSATLLFFGFTYIFLLDQSNYLNHFYLVCLLCFLMIFLPCHRDFSLDAARRPKIRSGVAPAWCLWILRIQIGIPYFYGGLAKLNRDWLSGEPMRTWLEDEVDFPFIGQFFTEEWCIYGISYAGLILDLAAVPLLLIPRTRILAVVLTTTFHLMNARLFSIGIFPWFMIATTPLFFGLPWHGTLRIGRLARIEFGPQETEAPSPSPPPRPSRIVATLLVVYLSIQLLLPLRHHLYPGYVSWTEEGHKFAWHMKLRTKRGSTTLFAEDPETGELWKIDNKKYLTDRQIRKVCGKPDMILSYARHVGEKISANRNSPVKITCRAFVSLNSRRRQPMIDPEIDLTVQNKSLAPCPWILPLTIDLDDR